jgi:monoamine oxidase
MPTGAIMKSHAIFDEPFWRADGLTGRSAEPGSIAPVTIDACNHDQRAGVLAIVAEGQPSPPGVLTEFGHALPAPCGRIHRAGTESSALMYGFVDGAIRSGERAAGEVLAA